MSNRITKWTIAIVCGIIIAVIIVDAVFEYRNRPANSPQETPIVMDKVSYTSRIGFTKITDTDSPNSDVSVTAYNMVSAFDDSISQQDILNGFNKGDDIALDMASNGDSAPPATTIAINNAIGDKLQYHAENRTGTDFQALLDYVENEKLPVMIWVTTDYNSPTHITSYQKYYGITKYDKQHYAIVQMTRNGQVIMSDSIYGELRLPKEQIRSIYDSCGRQCVFMVHN